MITVAIKNLRYLTWTDFWSLVAIVMFIGAVLMIVDIGSDMVVALR